MVVVCAPWSAARTAIVSCIIAFTSLSAQGQSPNELNLLAYNVYLRPTTLFNDGQLARAVMLPGVLSGYDAILLQEAFDDEARSWLLSGLEGEYPHRTSILGQDVGLHQDGGVIFVSRWPIVYQAQHVFEVCDGADCKAEKGVMYALINKGGRCYHLFGAHAQADDEAWQVRMDQFQAIRDFVASAHIRSDEPVIIAGDLNEDRYQEHYLEMLDRLGAAHPTRTGPAYTYDHEKNDLNDSGEFRYYDYVLYSRGHLRPVSAFNEVRILRSPEAWRRGFTLHFDLSDHYAVLGHFVFPPAPGLPCPSAGAYRNLSITGPLLASAGGRYQLSAVPEGGGPNFTYRWNNGATTAQIEAVAGEIGTSQPWRVEVTDVREGKTLAQSRTVSAVDTACLRACRHVRDGCLNCQGEPGECPLPRTCVQEYQECRGECGAPP